MLRAERKCDWAVSLNIVPRKQCSHIIDRVPKLVGWLVGRRLPVSGTRRHSKRLFLILLVTSQQYDRCVVQEQFMRDQEGADTNVQLWTPCLHQSSFNV